MAPSKKKYPSFLIGVMLFVLFVVGMGALTLMPNTLISPWSPVAVSALVALVTGLLAGRWWSRVTGRDNLALNRTCHFIAATILFTGIFYIANYGGADEATLHTENAVVGRKFYTVEHHTKRIARNRYAQGEPYNVYHMEVAFATGQTKELRIPLKLYRSISAGDTLALPVEMGLLGVPVVISSKLYQP